MEIPGFLRPLLFLLSLLILLAFEWKFPRRRESVSKKLRWPQNFSLIFISQILITLLVPVATITFSQESFLNKKGLFALSPLSEIPFPLLIAIQVMIMDFIIYWQHVIFHKVPFFWRFHRVHHMDLFIDASSALRFHPGEILISLGIKFGFIFLLGLHPLAVLIFEVVLNSMAMFNHGNIYVPGKVDRFLRYFIVTPDMHKTHHSQKREEHDNNYGFNLSWWDRLFSTYQQFSYDYPKNVNLGLKDFLDPKDHTLWALIKRPFLKK